MDESEPVYIQSKKIIRGNREAPQPDDSPWCLKVKCANSALQVGLEVIVESKSPFMVVKINFGRGLVVARRKGKNSRAALLGAGLLTMSSICLGSLAIWRFSQDVGLAGDFIFEDGVLSHWQVWLAGFVGTQYGGWRLRKYAKQAVESAEAEAAEESAETPSSLAANV
jgi:hypothetical protein